MKIKKFIILSVLSVLLMSCSSNNSDTSKQISEEVSASEQISSNDASSPEQISQEPVDTSKYTRYFEPGKAYRGTHNFSIDTPLYDRDLKLFVDNQEIEHEPVGPHNLDCYIEYSFDPENPAHSDTVEHAFNEMTWNEKSLGAIPSDDSKTIHIDFDDILDGSNYFSLTTGRVYAYNQKYDMNAVHGGTNGACDDYSIRNVHLVMSSGVVIRPSKMIFYKPVDRTSKNYRKVEVAYEEDKYYWIGDGWSGDLSYDGNPTEKWDCPFRIDFYFDYEMPNDFFAYSVDTSKYQDGTHQITIKDGNAIVYDYEVVFDNNGPEIDVNIDNYDYITNGYVVNISLSDTTTAIDKQTIYFDGKELETNTLKLNNLNMGNHNFTIEACDKAGNYSYVTKNFNITNNIGTLNVNSKEVKLSYNGNFNVDIYQANKLTYSSLNPINQLKQSSATIPYDEFEIDVEDLSKDVYFSYEGKVQEGERLKFEIFNPATNDYEQVLIANPIRKIDYSFDPSKYVSNNKVKIKVSPLYYGNDSKRLLWSSDTQYLPKVEFTDINYMYGRLMEYIVSEYKAGRMNYMVHTGDIVDNHPGYGNGAISEWVNASAAFRKLDDNDIPYGVCAGNHDVGTTANYIYYNQYFGINRYQSNDYYGGSLNNNSCHFDLFTIDNHDYIIVYVGYGIEARKETIKWVNEVLQTYSHRNAIIATHAYLKDNGDLDEASNASVIYEQMVVPNENVKFVFCGHNDGNALNKKQIDENRYVYEILNCYQFVEKEKYSVSHLISGLTCNGEAYIKELLFNGDTITCHTFSPITNGRNPYGSNDEFTIKVDLYEPDRQLTTYSFAACQKETKLSTRGIDSSCLIDFYNFDNNKDYLIYVSNETNYGFEII